MCVPRFARLNKSKSKSIEIHLRLLTHGYHHHTASLTFCSIFFLFSRSLSSFTVPFILRNHFRFEYIIFGFVFSDLLFFFVEQITIYLYHFFSLSFLYATVCRGIKVCKNNCSFAFLIYLTYSFWISSWELKNNTFFRWLLSSRQSNSFFCSGFETSDTKKRKKTKQKCGFHLCHPPEITTEFIYEKKRFIQNLKQRC